MSINRVRRFMNSLQTSSFEAGRANSLSQWVLIPTTLAPLYQMAWEQARFDRELSRLFNPNDTSR